MDGFHRNLSHFHVWIALYIFQHHGVVQLGSHEGLQLNVVPARWFLQHESRTGLFFLSEQQSFESTLNIIQLPSVFHVMTGPCECLVGLTLVLLLRLSGVGLPPLVNSWSQLPLPLLDQLHSASGLLTCAVQGCRDKAAICRVYKQ